MDRIKITIGGMGKTIASEVYLIADLLKSKGYDVEIEDEYPPEKEIDFDKIEGKGRKIKIITNHYPWPG